MIKKTTVIFGVFICIAIVFSSATFSAQFKNYGKEGKWWVTGPEEWVNTAAIKKDPPWKIGISYTFLGCNWMAQWLELVKYEASRYPEIRDLIILNANLDIRKQTSDIRDLIAQKVDAIFLDPLSPTALNPVIAEATKAGIPVFVNKAVILEANDFTQMISADNVAFGRMGGEHLAKALGGKGKIIAIRGIPGYPAEVQRWIGVNEVLSKYPGIKIVGKDFGYWRYDKSKEVGRVLLSAHPDIDGVYCAGADQAEAIIDLQKEMGLPFVPITGEDLNGFLKKWKQYDLNAVAPCDPHWIGAYGVQQMVNALMGMPVQKRIIWPAQTIPKEYIDKYLMPDMPNEVWTFGTLPKEKLSEMFRRKK